MHGRAGYGSRVRACVTNSESSGAVWRMAATSSLKFEKTLEERRAEIRRDDNYKVEDSLLQGREDRVAGIYWASSVMHGFSSSSVECARHCRGAEAVGRRGGDGRGGAEQGHLQAAAAGERDRVLPDRLLPHCRPLGDPLGATAVCFHTIRNLETMHD